ncbi:MAG: hypothetical protein JHC26_01400 [Thermofilum sp.]|jgi:hypothetical protein|uniref:hypothetical protein n=1 Tax=Thermofilum sp. TaxID=1961369 RepID=UPI002590638B|nr:hypothetical protein [Thermofilum sp.]MCI4407716.1 hypothetical protein [Thermofilum sp.]
MKRIYISDEAYEALVRYSLKSKKTAHGLSRLASELILEIVSQKLGENAPRGNVSQASPSNQVGEKSVKPGSKPAFTNKRSPLDSIEDLAVIRRVRSPERLAEKSKEKGLLFFDLGDVGMPDTVIVMKKTFADFVATEAEVDTITPSMLEEKVTKLLKEKESGYTDKEKYFIALYVLNRAGEILFNGRTWTKTSPDQSSQK